MLRTEATVGGCCWAVEPPWARRVGAAVITPSRTRDTAKVFIGFSLSCGAGAGILRFRGVGSHRQVLLSACTTRLRVSTRARQGGVLGLGDRGEGGFDDVESFVELFIGDDERDEDADDVVEGAGGDGDKAVLVAVAGDLLGFGVGRLARGGAADELDGAHAAKAAHLADEIPFPLPDASALFKTFADFGGARQQAILLYAFDHGERRGTRQGVSAKGSAEGARAGRVHNFGAAGDGGDGHAPAERLRHGDQVGLDAEMFGSEPLSGASEA